MDKDVPCEFCGAMTESVAGNPSRWPLFFCWPDGTGRVRGHHVGCVADRLFRRTTAHDDEMRRWYSKTECQRCRGIGKVMNVRLGAWDICTDCGGIGRKETRV